MDKFDNTPTRSENLPFSGSDAGVFTGDVTSTSLPNMSASDLSKPVVHLGSASGAAPELTPDMFSNCPKSHSDM